MALDIGISKPAYRVGEPEPPVISALSGSGDVIWTCDSGVCVPDRGAATSLSPLNWSRYAAFGDPVVVQGVDQVTGETGQVSVDVFATFRFQPDWGFEAEADEDAEVSPAEDGSEFIFQEAAWGRYPLGFNDREWDEFQEATAFRYRHGKVKVFYFENVAMGELVLARFDSAIRRQALESGGFSYSFVLKAPFWRPPAPAAPVAHPLYGEILFGDY